MRPLRLDIQGFTCFSDPVHIDFAGMDVFTVTGPTGAGKSTIIDAICFALYGRTPRQGAETVALMSHNRDSMRVLLEFEASGQRYRVGRSANVVRRTKKDGSETVSRAISPVQLEQLADGEWQPVSGRAKETTEEVERIVGLDFDAFQRCVVLPQGEFQEFLAGDAKVRRRILGELLSTGIYGLVMQAANTRAKELKQEAENIERRLSEDYADATPDALEAARKDLADAVPAREAAVALRDALTAALTSVVAVVNARGRAAEREKQRQAAVEEIKQKKQLGVDGAKRLAALKKDIAERDKEQSGVPYDVDRHAALRLARAGVLQLEKLGGELRKAIAAAKDTSKVDAAVADHARASELWKAADQALKETTALREDAEREDAAAHLREGLKPGDPCPVCGGVVGKVPKAAASTVAAARKREMAASEAQRGAAEAERVASTKVERAQHDQKLAKENMKRIEESIATANAELAAQLPKGVAPDGDAIAKALDDQEAALAERKRIEKMLAGLRSQYQDLEPKVAASAEAIAALEGQLKQLENAMAEDKREGDTEMAKLRALAEEQGWVEELALIDRKENPQASFTRKHAEATDAADRLVSHISQLTSDVTRIEKAIEKAKELREEATAKRDRAALYRDLGNLLHADEFQGFVISAAMAVLAETATEHLRNLYPRFEMVVENGEFKVVDDWQAGQVRSAKTLSGGETFVASLALALALSERLPELRSSAATRLESLFLDEGFGTLDPETLNTVMDALEALRSEDRMVGIVTHVGGMAERFADRIIVTKSPSGSRVEVVTGGGEPREALAAV